MILGGPWELSRPGKNRPDEGDPASLVQVLDLMDYTAGVLTENEHTMLSEAGVSAPTGWTLLKNIPVTRLVPAAPGTIGLIFLPQPAGKNGRLDSKQTEATKETIRDLKDRSGVSLVIGISPWGQRSEQDFLSSGGPLPDILLGSGPGSGMAGRIMDQGRTLWVRPYSKGKALNRIEILAIPDRAEGRGQRRQPGPCRNKSS